MRNMSIVDFLASISFNYESIVPEIVRIGDITAIRKNKGKTYRRNYARAILFVALARKFQLSSFLEFGTGRGFICASLLSLCNMDIISTIDKEPPDVAMSLIDSLGLNSRTIKCITANANTMQPENLKHSYDLVFIDAQHDSESVKLNYNLVKTKLKSRSIIVFDDYRRKFLSVKKQIDLMSFKYKLLLHTDGWIVENSGINFAQDADKVIDGKEHGSGMVLCSNTVSF